MRETVFLVFYRYEDNDEEDVEVFRSEDGAYDFKRYLETTQNFEYAVVKEKEIFGNLYDYML